MTRKYRGLPSEITISCVNKRRLGPFSDVLSSRRLFAVNSIKSARFRLRCSRGLCSCRSLDRDCNPVRKLRLWMPSLDRIENGVDVISACVLLFLTPSKSSLVFLDVMPQVVRHDRGGKVVSSLLCVSLLTVFGWRYSAFFLLGLQPRSEGVSYRWLSLPFGVVTAEIVRFVFVRFPRKNAFFDWTVVLPPFRQRSSPLLDRNRGPVKMSEVWMLSLCLLFLPPSRDRVVRFDRRFTATEKTAAVCPLKSRRDRD